MSAIDTNCVDDGHIKAEELTTEADLARIEREYWTSDVPRYVHDIVATLRYLRNRIVELEKEIEKMPKD